MNTGVQCQLTRGLVNLSKRKTKEEIAYHDYLAGRDCVACGDSPVTVHHIRSFDGLNVGVGNKSSHHLAIPLCPDCHQGPDSIHHNKKVFEMRWGTEVDLLIKTMELTWRDMMQMMMKIVKAGL